MLPTAYDRSLAFAALIRVWARVLEGGGNLRLGLGRRQSASFRNRLEAATAVTPVAEGLVFGLTAAAEANHSAASQIERLAVRIDDGELPFDPARSVVAYGNRCSGHRSFLSRLLQGRVGPCQGRVFVLCESQFAEHPNDGPRRVDLSPFGLHASGHGELMVIVVQTLSSGE